MAKSLLEIGNDIERDITFKLTDKKLRNAEVKVLKRMDEIKNQQTQQGKSPAEGGRWNNVYNRQYANRRKGGRRSPVTLRDRKERIEETTTSSNGDRSELRFRDREAGNIFFMHDSGTARGGKYRQIYPDSDAQVPEELDQAAEQAIDEILGV